MIHTDSPFDVLALSAIPYPVYVKNLSLPMEFSKKIFCDLAVSKIYSDEFLMYTPPFIH